MLGTEVASAVLTSERQECFLSTFLAYHCSVFTRLQLSLREVNEVYVFLFFVLL
jgi:hypothetical protein